MVLSAGGSLVAPCWQSNKTDNTRPKVYGHTHMTLCLCSVWKKLSGQRLYDAAWWQQSPQYLGPWSEYPSIHPSLHHPLSYAGLGGGRRQLIGWGHPSSSQVWHVKTRKSNKCHILRLKWKRSSFSPNCMHVCMFVSPCSLPACMLKGLLLLSAKAPWRPLIRVHNHRGLLPDCHPSAN